MNNYRPLKMLHGYAYPEGSTTEGKKEIIEKRIDDLHDKGYGGIVTNVDFGKNYLKDEESWLLFRHAVSYAANRWNMKIWIYDESGYPSGSAGGLTLTENPDFECQALAMIKYDAKAGDSVVIEKPRGHKDVIDSYAITNGGLIVDLKEAVSDKGTLTYVAQEKCSIYYFVSKRLYEGTHAQHNTCASRRYISLINKEAVAAFIRNTYKAYTDHLEGLEGIDGLEGLKGPDGIDGAMPGGVIQAFFTDEPSFQACYINEGLNPSVIDDPYDSEMPLYPIVAWEKGLDSIYYEKYGESLSFKLHMLFESDEPEAKKLRYRFYKMLSELYEDAFFKQISEFCREHGTAFSGHLLLEENILHHPLFEGNFFELIRHMHIPGIDMLFTKPASVMRFAATPKLISSAASWYARPHVMSEISGHTENALRIPFDINDIICAQLLQFALGVDIFNSYFDDDALTLSENRMLCGSISNVCEEFSGKISMANVLLYYPIESAQTAVKGSAEQLQNRAYDSGAIECEESWRSHIDGLLRSHYMFDCVSGSSLCEAEIWHAERENISGGAGNKKLSKKLAFIKSSMSRPYYTALIVPKLTAITSAAAEMFIKIAEEGVPVIINDLSECIIVDSQNDSIISQLNSCENIIHVSSARDSIAALGNIMPPAAYICPCGGGINGSNDDSISGNIIMLAKRDDLTYNVTYLLLNISDAPISADITLTDAAEGAIIANPISESPLKWKKAEASPTEDGLRLHIDMPGLGALLIKGIN